MKANAALNTETEFFKTDRSDGLRESMGSGAPH